MASVVIEKGLTINAVHCVSHSPNGYRAITGSDGKTIRIWDAESGAVVGETLRSGMLNLMLSSAGLLAGANDSTRLSIPDLYCWRCKADSLLARWTAHYLRVLRPHHSNLECQYWCCGWKTFRGRRWLGTVRCLLSRRPAHHPRIRGPHHSNLGCREWRFYCQFS
jgi:WD40 repeat protein